MKEKQKLNLCFPLYVTLCNNFLVSVLLLQPKTFLKLNFSFKVINFFLFDRECNGQSLNFERIIMFLFNRSTWLASKISSCQFSVR